MVSEYVIFEKYFEFRVYYTLIFGFLIKYLYNDTNYDIMAMMIDENDVLEISGYLNTMNSRLMSLHKTSEEISRNINNSQIKVSQKKNEYLRLINDIKKDIAEMKEEIRNLQKSIIQVITVLKDSIKADEFVRFKKRIDLWAPESFVTRKEVNDVLGKQ